MVISAGNWIGLPSPIHVRFLSYKKASRDTVLLVRKEKELGAKSFRVVLVLFFLFSVFLYFLFASSDGWMPNIY